jgi:hypothetical protein
VKFKMSSSSGPACVALLKKEIPSLDCDLHSYVQGERFKCKKGEKKRAKGDESHHTFSSTASKIKGLRRKKRERGRSAAQRRDMRDVYRTFLHGDEGRAAWTYTTLANICI